MKLNEAERLANLAINACYNQYKLLTSPNKTVALNLQEKLNIIYTAKVVIEGKKGKMSNDAYYQYENHLTQLEDNLKNQIMASANVAEMILSLSTYIV